MYKSATISKAQGTPWISKEVFNSNCCITPVENVIEVKYVINEQHDVVWVSGTIFQIQNNYALHTETGEDNYPIEDLWPNVSCQEISKVSRIMHLEMLFIEFLYRRLQITKKFWTSFGKCSVACNIYTNYFRVLRYVPIAYCFAFSKFLMPVLERICS